MMDKPKYIPLRGFTKRFAPMVKGGKITESSLFDVDA